MSADLRRYALTGEPVGNAYSEIIYSAHHWCERLLLVVQPGLRLDSFANQILAELEPQLLTERETSEWPGTRLYDHVAIVREYTFTHAVAHVLATAADRLFAWQQPSLPEDPCLLRRDGSSWLTTIVHERDAYFELSESELRRLLQAAPSLELLLEMQK